MQKSITSILHFGVLALLALSLNLRAADEKKTDPSGTWKWSFTGQDGTVRDTTLKLKVDGDKVTGSVTGRNGDTEIEKGKVSGDEISFQVTREFNGNKFTAKYKGKISGDAIKGKMEFERDGETTSREWEAKREGAKKADDSK